MRGTMADGVAVYGKVQGRVFLKNLPRFCFRLLSWALLAVAGIMLVRILSS